MNPEGKPAPPQPPALPERDHLRRLRVVFERYPIYFITCCTAQRQPILTSAGSARIILAAWRDSPKIHGWVIGRHVVMPDHVHFFSRARPDAKPLPAFMRDWKKWTGRKIAEFAQLSPPVWQPEYFDHVLRSAHSYSEKWDYVRANPVRAGLAATPEAWPHAGEGEDLMF